MLLETAILFNSYEMPNSMTEEEYVSLCDTNIIDYPQHQDKIHIIANLLVKLILLRRAKKYYYTDYLLRFIGNEHLCSISLARICLRAGDGDLYTKLDKLGTFTIAPDLPIIACTTNDYTLVSTLIKQSLEYYNTVFVNDSKDLICCEKCDPKIFNLIEIYLNNDDILHIWNMTDSLDLTKYIWKNYNTEAFGGFITTSQLIDKSVWSGSNPDIVKFVDLTLKKKQPCSLQ